MSEFRDKTIQGVSWSVVSQFGQQLLTVGIGIILARLLSPREFGLVAMVMVLTNFVSIFAELGFSAALVQKQDITQEHLSSVFWLNVGAGLLLTLVFIAISPLIATFYGEPLLTQMTMVIATTFLISSLNIVQNTLLTKTLDFKSMAKVEIGAVSSSGALAIAMAIGGFGVWSLVARYVIQSIVTALTLWRVSEWRPSFVFRWDAVRDLLGFSMSLFATNVLNYWARNIDDLLIGKVLGTGPLGIYNRAYHVMLFPLTNVSRVVSRVMFPAFSIIQDDKPRVKAVYLKMTAVIALVSFPMMLGLFVTVEPFVGSVFGLKWIGMVPVLQVLSLVGLVQSIGTLNGNLYLSQGRADLQLRVGVVIKIAGIIAIIVGLKWGIVGVAIAYATVSVLGSYPGFFFCGRLVGLRYAALMVNLTGVFGCAAGMAISVWGLGEMLPVGWPYWAFLAVQVPFGVLVYTMLITVFGVEAFRDLRALLLRQEHL